MTKNTTSETKSKPTGGSITPQMSVTTDETTNTDEGMKTETGVLYLGIDLGTSRTSVAASNGQRVTLSSHVGYPKDVVSRKLLKKEVLFGDEAVHHRLSCNFYRPLAAGVLKLSNNKTDDVAGNMKAAADLIRESIKHARPRNAELVFAVTVVTPQ